MTDLIFCFDRLEAPDTPYPNLARTQDWSRFDHEWPRTIPFRLLNYLSQAQIDFRITTVWDEFDWAWYPVGIGWFDLDLDYFSLIADVVLERIRRGQIGVLFYYHEGDNPYRMRNKLRWFASNHKLPENCFHVISANTAARHLQGFSYFPDHEFFFRWINRDQLPLTLNREPSPAIFTAVNRYHKWWRATVMSGLWRHGLLENSLWSYNTASLPAQDHSNENPINLEPDTDWKNHLQKFLEHTPHKFDTFSADQHNIHQWVNPDLFRSHCHIVLETYFDVDQSGGVFLTEKTFKPIKFGQPFMIAGPAGSLQELRDMGYKTFDKVIDNHYDTIQDNYQRALALIESARQVNRTCRHQGWWHKLLPDLAHNQEMFARRCHEPIYKLLEEIKCQ